MSPCKIRGQIKVFCPDGFVTLRSLYDRFSMESAQLEADPSAALFAEIPQENIGRLLHECTPADLREHRLLIAVSKNMYLCSPNGALLRFDMRSTMITYDSWSFSVFDIERAAKEHPVREPMPEDFFWKYMLVRYPYDELIEDMRADPEGPMHFLESAGIMYYFSLLAPFYERAGYTINLDAYDYVARAHNFIEAPEFAAISDVLRPFCGWSICLTEEYASSGWVEDIRKGATAEAINNGAGRPATVRRDTRQAYSELFPDGHGNEQWLKVLRRVNQRTGHAASLDTLKRAIRDLQCSKTPGKIEAK